MHVGFDREEGCVMAPETAAAEEAKENPEDTASTEATNDKPEADEEAGPKTQKSETDVDQEEQRQRERWKRVMEAIERKHKEVCDNPDVPSESEQALDTRRQWAGHYLDGMDGYETREKWDRMEFFFDGQDGEVHTVFQTTVKQDNEDRMFFGYYGRFVDEEASLAAVLKAVDAGLDTVEVQGTKKQQALLAKLAVEYGLEVSNYDTSAFEGPKETNEAAEPEAGVAEAEADASTPETPEVAAETPKIDELALATTDSQPDAEPEVTETGLSTDVAEPEPTSDELRSRFYEDALNGKWEFRQDPDGSVTMHAAKSTDESTSQFADEDIIDAEFEVVEENKSAFGSTEAPKQIGAGEGQAVSGYLEAKQDDNKPAASSNFLPAPKADQPKSDDKSPKQITDGGRSGQKRLPGPSGNKP